MGQPLAERFFLPAVQVPAVHPQRQAAAECPAAPDPRHAADAGVARQCGCPFFRSAARPEGDLLRGCPQRPVSLRPGCRRPAGAGHGSEQHPCHQCGARGAGGRAVLAAAFAPPAAHPCAAPRHHAGRRRVQRRGPVHQRVFPLAGAELCCSAQRRDLPLSAGERFRTEQRASDPDSGRAGGAGPAPLCPAGRLQQPPVPLYQPDPDPGTG